MLECERGKQMKSGLIVVVAGLLIGVASAQTSGGMMSGGAMGSATVGNFAEIDDGARIYYEVHGEGEPIVLVHGYPLNSGLFRDNVGPLSKQYQVITIRLVPR